MDYIDASLACPPVAPSAIDIERPLDSPRSSDTFSECDGRETIPFQSPSLLDRLREYRNNARAAETAIERREWTEAGENLIAALFDPRRTCWCGVVLNNLTGKCDDCLERKARIARKLRDEGEQTND